MISEMKIAVIGATGLVGREMLKVLEERKMDFSVFLPVASGRSAGKQLQFNDRQYTVIEIEEALEARPEIAVFSAGAAISLKWAPEFAGRGTVVIDNSSAWRMDPDVPLIVPEVNAGLLNHDHRIIANPNCSTIQLVMVLAPLHKAYGIKRVVVSTYQSVTGSGEKAIRQLENERKGINGNMIFPHAIDLNLIPEAGGLAEDGYTTEEIKLVNETRKILNDEKIKLTATAVRVPVYGGHSEAVNIEFEKDFKLEEIRELLSCQAGIVVEDDLAGHRYPMPLNSRGLDEVFTGRIRRDFSVATGLNLWIVADNLRKGAATNAIQIAKYMIDQKIVG